MRAVTPPVTGHPALQLLEEIMKTIVSALVALSVIAGFAAQANATFKQGKDTKTIKQLDREGRGGHMN
jgi:hypothetical protein